MRVQGVVMVEAASRRVVVLTSKVDGGDVSTDRGARISYPNDLAIDEVCLVPAPLLPDQGH